MARYSLQALEATRTARYLSGPSFRRWPFKKKKYFGISFPFFYLSSPRRVRDVLCPISLSFS